MRVDLEAERYQAVWQRTNVPDGDYRITVSLLGLGLGHVDVRLGNKQGSNGTVPVVTGNAVPIGFWILEGAVRAANLPPAVTITALPAGAVSAGPPTVFAGSALDVRDGDFSSALRWSSSLQGELGIGASVNAVVVPGVHLVTAEVEDSFGATGRAQVTVLVIDDTAPTAVLSAPGSVGFGASFTLHGSGSSDAAPGSIVQYRWTHVSGSGGPIPTGGTVVTSDPSFTLMVTAPDPLAVRSHVFSLVVVDDAGNASAADQRAVVVTAGYGCGLG